MENYPFPTNTVAFVAAATLNGGVVIRRVSDNDFEMTPFDKARQLFEDYREDRLVFSARQLAEQIRELKRLRTGDVISNPAGGT